MDGFSVQARVLNRPVIAPLRAGVVGAGSFGAHHARKLASLPGAHFIGAADHNLERAEALAGGLGGRGFGDVDALIEACEAIIIASPASTHADIAARAIQAGVHVLVEKPLAATVEDADRLVRLAHRNGVVLQAGHQERFVIEALGLLDAGVAPMAIQSVRAAPYSSRGADVSITLDLMIHDLDLVASLFGASPLSIEATARSLTAGTPFDEVEARLVFAAGEAHLKASRMAPERRRTMRADYPRGAVEIDFLARTMRDESGLGLDPDFAAKTPDPLGASVEAFLAAASGRAPCAVPGEAGAAAVRLACAIDAAARRH